MPIPGDHLHCILCGNLQPIRKKRKKDEPEDLGVVQGPLPGNYYMDRPLQVLHLDCSGKGQRDRFKWTRRGLSDEELEDLKKLLVEIVEQVDEEIASR